MQYSLLFNNRDGYIFKHGIKAEWNANSFVQVWAWFADGMICNDNRNAKNVFDEAICVYLI